MEGFNQGRIQLLVEADLPLNDGYLRIHALLLVWRWIKWIESQPHTRVHYISDNFLQKRARGLQAWIRINFNQVHLELLVEHEIEAEYFKSVVLQCARWRHYFVRGAESVRHNLLDLTKYVRTKVDLQMAKVLI